MKSKTIFIALAIFATLFGAQCKKEITVPDELIGVWETTYPGFDIRPFEIKKATLIFEQGLGYFDFVTYPIVGIKQTFENGDILYVISYLIPDGLTYKFSFYYTPANGGEIRFKNRSQVKWTKKKS